MQETEKLAEWIKWALIFVFGSGGLLGFFISRVLANLDRRNAYDKETMKRIVDDLSKLISSIRLHDFGAAYRHDIHSQMDRFELHSVEPEYKFLNKKLEKIRLELDDAVLQFNHKLALNSHHLPTSAGHTFGKIYTSRYEEVEDYDKYERLRSEINSMADKVCKLYDELIRSAKMKV